MTLAFSITAAVMTFSFLAAGGYVLVQARRVTEPRFCRLLGVFGFASMIMGMMGLFFLFMGLAHIHLDPLPSIERAMVFGFAVMAASFWMAVLANRVVREVAEPLRKAERVLEVLSSQIPVASVAELGLTARELEVVSVIADGSLTDAQIADRLFISKATAATHVRNVLKKADLNNRRDLMLLGGWRDIAPADRPVRPSS